MIHATVVGRLGKAAELYENNGSVVLKFSVATEHRKGRDKITTWVGVAFWGKRGAAIEKYLNQGTQVAVRGYVYLEEYNGKTYLRCTADDVQLLGSKKEASNETTYTPDYQSAADEDIPF